MFRHNNDAGLKETAEPKPVPSVEEKLHSDNGSRPAAIGFADVPAATLKELVEKNLKWSQIIYEQNRKINHKLLWNTIANWVRLVIIIVPLAIALFFLPRIISDYNCLVKGTCQNTTGAKSVEDLLKYLPLGPAESDRLKAILK